MLQSMKDYSHDIRPKETVHLELQHRLQTLQLRQPRHVRQKRMYLIRVLRTCNIRQRIKKSTLYVLITWVPEHRLLRQGSMVKKSPWPFEQSHRVTLRCAQGLARWAQRCFAALSMTGLDRSVNEELSSACEPCLKNITLRGDKHFHGYWYYIITDTFTKWKSSHFAHISRSRHSE